MKMLYNHPFHLVSFSPWPIITSFSVMIMMLGNLNMFNYKNMNFMLIGFTLILLCSFQWWRDLIRESTFQGMHTKLVIKGLKIGMILFIVSELMFFISFFELFFIQHSLQMLKLVEHNPPKMLFNLIHIMFHYYYFILFLSCMPFSGFYMS